MNLGEFFLWRGHVPLIDVRSPREFAQGHIAQAINIPLLNDEERHLVGTTYKQQGQAQAIKEGFRLVGPRLAEMVEATLQIAANHEALVYCWRGGMRSRNFSLFVGMAGVKSHVLQGGYKAYRQTAHQTFAKPLTLRLLTGFTGSGKTDILQALRRAGHQVINLEALASHKGSAFGGIGMLPQPTTEQFENLLFEELRMLDPSKPIWVEDESIAIGKVFVPPLFWRQMNNSPLIRIDVPRAVRVQRLVREYGRADKAAFLLMMEKIVKRLGGQHFKSAKEKLEADDMPAVMEILLTYYDKAYALSMNKRRERLCSAVPWDGQDIEALLPALSHEPKTVGTR
jgi:tRNA 2-selenouridine synthase